MKSSILKLGVTLMIVGLAAAVGLGFTYAVTKSKIEEYDKQIEAKAAMAAMPGLNSIHDLREDKALEEKIEVVEEGVQKVYVSDRGYVFKVTMKGYGGPLSLAIGVGLDGKVKGIAVISSKETVGLGTKVLEDEGVGMWLGKSGSDKLEVGEDIQGVTGATITTKAVNNEVKRALEAFARLK